MHCIISASALFLCVHTGCTLMTYSAPFMLLVNDLREYGSLKLNGIVKSLL